MGSPTSSDTIAKRLRLDYESLCEFRPDIVYLESTGYGSDGPNAFASGSDIVAQAYSGLMAGEGKVDEFGAPKSISCAPVADYTTGLAAAMGICAALFERSRSGKGQVIDAAMVDGATSLAGSIYARAMEGVPCCFTAAIGCRQAAFDSRSISRTGTGVSFAVGASGFSASPTGVFFSSIRRARNWRSSSSDSCARTTNFTDIGSMVRPPR